MLLEAPIAPTLLRLAAQAGRLRALWQRGRGVLAVVGKRAPGCALGIRLTKDPRMKKTCASLSAS